MNCSGATKTPKSAKSIYEKMKIVDPNKAESVSGPRRVYKGSMKSQFEQHVKYLEGLKGKDGDHK